MRKRKINQELFDLLSSGQWDDFSISELKSAYMALPKCPHRTEKAAWQFVYRNVVRMEDDGLISRTADLEGIKPRYQWRGSIMTAVKREAPSPMRNTPDDATLNSLKEKLHQYKEEMLTAIGETEEYDALCKELPHMRSLVQGLYNDARDRCSKILGRVKALESVLANQLSVSS